MRLHVAENLNCLLNDRKEYVQRQRNEPTEHNGVFSFKLFDPTNVIFIVFEHTYPVDARTHSLTHALTHALTHSHYHFIYSKDSKDI